MFFCWFFPSFKCPDRPPASALLLCAPSRLLGVPFTLMGKAGSCGSGWQGGTLAVTYKRVSGSELETVWTLKEISALSLGVRGVEREGRGLEEQTFAPAGHVACL